jgi:hypothetical protein
VFGFCGLIRGEVGIVDVDEVQILVLFLVLMKLLVGLYLEFIFHAPILFISLTKDNGLKFCLHKVVLKDTKKLEFLFF